jgi:hypothetical protein
VNALGIVYVVLAGVSLMQAMAHVAQARLIRSDKTQPLMALLCFAFALFNLGVTWSSSFTGTEKPAWLGWHVMASVAAAVLTVVVPGVAWTILEVQRTRAREVAMGFCILLAGWRLVGLAVLLQENPVQTWETIHSLDHAWVALPSGACALMGAGTWTAEGVLGMRRGQQYALPMTLFGLTAFLASTQGLLVTLQVLSPPDLFALSALPSAGFVQVLSTLRRASDLRVRPSCRCCSSTCWTESVSSSGPG